MRWRWLKAWNCFIWSSLSDASKLSGGKYKRVYHFDSKAHVVEYIRSTYPGLASKMSILQMGLFVDNWKAGEVSVPWKKVGTVLHKMSDVRADGVVDAGWIYEDSIVFDMVVK